MVKRRKSRKNFPNIWTYKTEDDGLISNKIVNVVGGQGKEIYAATADGLCVSNDLGETWTSDPDVALDVAFIAINKQNGTILWDGDDRDKGLRVKPKNGDMFYITKDDGIASNRVGCIAIDESVKSDDVLGAVYLGHWSEVISKYDVQSKTWQVLRPREFEGVIDNINRFKFYDGTLYVCADGALAMSSDGEKSWTIISDPNINPTHGSYPDTDQLANWRMRDFHIDKKGTWYLAYTSSTISFILTSTDKGKSWGILFETYESPFCAIDALGNDLFFLSQQALRVFNIESKTVKIFTPQNGLDTGDWADLFADKFFFDETNIYVPTNSGIAIARLEDIKQYPPIWQYATQENGLNSNTIYSIASGGRENTSEGPATVMAGGDKGLSGTRDGGKTWKTFDQVGDINIKGQKINGAYARSSSLAWSLGVPNILIATDEIGAVIFRDPYAPGHRKAMQYTTKDGLASNRVMCGHYNIGSISPPYRFSIYLGHSGEGISWCDYDGKWRVANKSNGLAGNYVLNIRQLAYQKKTYLYACGYDHTPHGNVQSALSISGDGGITWQGINSLNIDSTDWQTGLVYDIWSSYDGSDEVFALVAGETQANTAMFIIKSANNGETWTLIDSPPDGVEKGCLPSISQDKNYMYMPTRSSLFVCEKNMDLHKRSRWMDGLQGRHTGAVVVDANGHIYMGTEGLGIALSNTDCIPFFDDSQ